MKTKAQAVVFLFLLLLWAQQGAATDSVSSADDRTSVEITVYNSNIGLVKEVRQVSLPRGIHELKFMDVASQIMPASVNIRGMGSSGELIVLEQNYEFDLLSPRKLLDKYVGKQVKLRTRNPYTDKEEIVAAMVMSNNEGQPVFKIGNEITYGYPGTILFPEIPENLISKPTLLWLLDNRGDPSRNIETLYLTNGITWQADYVLVLNYNDTKADLSGWVTITNRSGAGYKDAKLKLVAGEVNRVPDEGPRPRTFKTGALMADAAPQFREAAFLEYHIYTMDRKTTVKENQTKQISLLDAGNIPIKKELLFRGMPEYYRNRLGDTIATKKIEVYVEFQNRKEQNLGMPLPKGMIRVYKHDKDESLQFAGEDSIEHTPRDEKIKVKLGNAFDMAASRKQTLWEKIATNVYEVAFEISLRNHKKEDETVKVVEPLSGNWKILESSHKYTRIDAFTVSFDIPVKADGESKLTYRARINY